MARRVRYRDLDWQAALSATERARLIVLEARADALDQERRAITRERTNLYQLGVHRAAKATRKAAS